MDSIWSDAPLYHQQKKKTSSNKRSLYKLHAELAYQNIPSLTGCPLDICGGAILLKHQKNNEMMAPIPCPCAVAHTRLPITLGSFSTARWIARVVAFLK